MAELMESWLLFTWLENVNHHEYNLMGGSSGNILFILADGQTPTATMLSSIWPSYLCSLTLIQFGNKKQHIAFIALLLLHMIIIRCIQWPISCNHQGKSKITGTRILLHDIQWHSAQKWVQEKMSCVWDDLNDTILDYPSSIQKEGDIVTLFEYVWIAMM